jgi:DMSO/TMAO reductase YedYZ molybdopterin-dependent catalytic subunit
MGEKRNEKELRKYGGGRWKLVIGSCVGLMALLLGCVSPATETAMTPTPTLITASPTPKPSATLCPLPTIIAPTPPAEVPGYAQLDETTGLHITGTAKEIDLADYLLEITGKVNNPLSLTYDDLRCMPKVEVHSELICVGFFQDEATWAGVPIMHILEMAEMWPDATEIRMRGADLYSTSLDLDLVREGEGYIIAYEWESQPLPILHGFPVRGVFPDQEGNKWVKWLLEIEVR